MQTSGIFTTHVYDIPFKKYGEPIYIIPFGDVHRDSTGCHVDKWFNFLDWARKKKRCYFIGMGDYFDLGSTTEREILGNPHLHDSTVKTLDGFLAKNVGMFSQEIMFMKPTLIGLMEGNHFGKFSSGMTTDNKLCEIMGCKYLGVSTFIRLVFHDGNNHCKALDIWAHHGRGAGRLLGSSINNLEQMVKSAEADIYMAGHDHRKSATPGIPRLYLGNAKRGKVDVHYRKTLLVRTGSFLKGYVDGESSYIADAAMTPTDLGVVKIEITPKSKDTGNVLKLDLHASI